MKFCPDCGARTQRTIPPDEDRERDVCTSCARVHYVNPKVIVGCVPEHEGKILMCKRAIQPRYGLWTLPAGFMENGETTAEGAARETWEEAAGEACIALERSGLRVLRLVRAPYLSQGLSLLGTANRPFVLDDAVFVCKRAERGEREDG